MTYLTCFVAWLIEHRGMFYSWPDVEACASKYGSHQCSAGAGHSGPHRAKMNETQELFWLDSYAQTTVFQSLSEVIPAKPGYRILDIRTVRQPAYIQEKDPNA
jgi:hypothetical protein